LEGPAARPAFLISAWNLLDGLAPSSERASQNREIKKNTPLLRKILTMFRSDFCALGGVLSDLGVLRF
jgi:hypothetical protein